jgi:hypothetical protein
MAASKEKGMEQEPLKRGGFRGIQLCIIVEYGSIEVQ